MISRNKNLYPKPSLISFQTAEPILHSFRFNFRLISDAQLVCDMCWNWNPNPAPSMQTHDTHYLAATKTHPGPDTKENAQAAWIGCMMFTIEKREAIARAQGKKPWLWSDIS